MIYPFIPNHHYAATSNLVLCLRLSSFSSFPTAGPFLFLQTAWLSCAPLSYYSHRSAAGLNSRSRVPPALTHSQTPLGAREQHSLRSCSSVTIVRTPALGGQLDLVLPSWFIENFRRFGNYTTIFIFSECFSQCVFVYLKKNKLAFVKLLIDTW